MSSGLERIRVLKERGLVYVWDDVVNLNTNSPFVYSFNTGINDVVLRHIRVESPSQKAMEHATIELFSDGGVSGGTQLFVSQFSDVNPPPSNFSDPFSSVFRDRTVDTPGAKFFGQNMVGDKFVTFDKLHSFIFLRKETLYYIILTNLMGNNDLLRIEVLAAVST